MTPGSLALRQAPTLISEEQVLDGGVSPGHPAVRRATTCAGEISARVRFSGCPTTGKPRAPIPVSCPVLLACGTGGVRLPSLVLQPTFRRGRRLGASNANTLEVSIVPALDTTSDNSKANRSRRDGLAVNGHRGEADPIFVMGKAVAPSKALAKLSAKSQQDLARCVSAS